MRRHPLRPPAVCLGRNLPPRPPVVACSGRQLPPPRRGVVSSGLPLPRHRPLELPHPLQPSGPHPQPGGSSDRRRRQRPSPSPGPGAARAGGNHRCAPLLLPNAETLCNNDCTGNIPHASEKRNSFANGTGQMIHSFSWIWICMLLLGVVHRSRLVDDDDSFMHASIRTNGAEQRPQEIRNYEVISTTF